MAVLVSTLLYLISFVLQLVCAGLEVIAGVLRALQIEVTFEFVIIISLLFYKNRAGQIVVVASIAIIYWLETCRSAPIGLGVSSVFFQSSGPGFESALLR
jgi:hypothetical protein